jgi:hypothetical protein
MNPDIIIYDKESVEKIEIDYGQEKTIYLSAL